MNSQMIEVDCFSDESKYRTLIVETPADLRALPIIAAETAKNLLIGPFRLHSIRRYRAVGSEQYTTWVR